MMVANLIALVSVALLSTPQAKLPERAAADLVRNWTRTVTDGVLPLEFNEAGWLGFGPLSFEVRVLTRDMEVCAWIADTEIDNRTAAEVQNIAAVERALNDPTIGGMYERAGADFRWDRSVEAILLCRSLALSTEQEIFDAQIEELLDVALEWKLTWFHEVTMIVHDGQAKRDALQTRSLLKPEGP